ncbi:MAG: caspase family protein, partial [Planctomycetota bacterium]
MAVTPDGKHLFSGGRDQSVRLWDIESGEYLASLYSFRDGTWAVVDAEGRYDAPGGESAGLHWVVGLEAIALEQLKERYYEPGLLAKLLGHSSEPLRTVDALVAQGVPLPPKAVILPFEPGSTLLRVELTSCGSGFGPVAVRVNKKEVVADARPLDFDPDAHTLALTLDLADEPAFVPGLENEIEVVAEDAAEVLSARGVSVTLEPARAPSGRTPELWALVVGASDYAGNALDLRYAASDAERFARALELCARGLFGAERTHVELQSDGENAATRERVKRGLDRLKEAQAEDVVVVYLAGHGVSLGTDASDFYFVLPSALTLEGLSDPAVRAAHTLAGAELRARLNTLAARKAVLILDTCHAGAVADTRAQLG